MPKEFNLGNVRGKDATINGQNAVNITADNGVEMQQNGGNIRFSAPGVAEHNQNKSNPHGVTKEQIGLGNVENKTPTEILSEMTKENVEQALGYTPAQTAEGSATFTEENANKLAGIEPGANKTVVENEYNGTSSNPISGTGIEAELNRRATEVNSTLSAMNTAIEGKFDKVEGTPGQVLGFDEDGNLISMDYTPVDPTPPTPPTPVVTEEIYGFQIDMAESSPANKISYIAGTKNENYAKAGMNFTAGTFSYGDWMDAFFIKNLKVAMMKYDGTIAYELDKNNYAKKADGTASDIANDGYAGNVMVGFPTIWIKIDTVSNPGKVRVYIANTKVDETYHAYAHTSQDGNIADYTWRAAYDGWKDSSGRIRSISGKVPTREMTGEAQIAAARANNTAGGLTKDGWDIDILSQRQMINMLLMLIGKNTDTCAVFGFGNDNGYNSHAAGSDTNGVVSTGTLNDKGLFFGYNAHNLAVKVFGIENWWGNIWKRTQGYILNKTQALIKLTKSVLDGTTVNDYNTDGNGYIKLSSTPSGTSGGYISEMESNQYGIFPKTASGSDSTHFPDGLWFNTSQVNFALFGGDSINGLLVGAFACTLPDAVGYSSWNFGCSLSFIRTIP